MWRVALRMLVGDRAKYLGLVFGITFATLLMGQQVSIFISLMARTASQIDDIKVTDIWVMDPQVQYFDVVRPMASEDLLKVRSVPGVSWAVPLFKGLGVVKAQGQPLNQIIVMGLDNASLVGGPFKMIAGNWEDIREPQAMVMDELGWKFIWPNNPYELGREVEINDQRVKIVGICDAAPPFMTFPIVYTRYSEAINLVPQARNNLTFILVKADPADDPVAVARRIEKDTGLQALTNSEFRWRSINYYLQRTGIPINFGITVLLGFIVGAAVAGQTLYMFVMENLKQFAALKAIGVTNRQILSMVLLQAFLSAFIGFGIGIGLAAFFFFFTEDTAALKGFRLHGEVITGSGIVVFLIITFASIFSLRKVFRIDLAIVFRG